MTIQPQTIESARRAYHDTCVEFAEVDGKLIDATAIVSRLTARHADVTARRDAAREVLVRLHADEQPAPAVTARVRDLLNPGLPVINGEVVS